MLSTTTTTTQSLSVLISPVSSKSTLFNNTPDKSKNPILSLSSSSQTLTPSTSSSSSSLSSGGPTTTVTNTLVNKMINSSENHKQTDSSRPITDSSVANENKNVENTPARASITGATTSTTTSKSSPTDKHTVYPTSDSALPNVVVSTASSLETPVDAKSNTPSQVMHHTSAATSPPIPAVEILNAVSASALEKAQKSTIGVVSPSVTPMSTPVRPSPAKSSTSDFSLAIQNVTKSPAVTALPVQQPSLEINSSLTKQPLDTSKPISTCKNQKTSAVVDQNNNANVAASSSSSVTTKPTKTKKRIVTFYKIIRRKSPSSSSNSNGINSNNNNNNAGPLISTHSDTDNGTTSTKRKKQNVISRRIISLPASKLQQYRLSQSNSNNVANVSVVKNMSSSNIKAKTPGASSKAPSSSARPHSAPCTPVTGSKSGTRHVTTTPNQNSAHPMKRKSSDMSGGVSLPTTPLKKAVVSPTAKLVNNVAAASKTNIIGTPSKPDSSPVASISSKATSKQAQAEQVSTSVSGASTAKNKTIETQAGIETVQYKTVPVAGKPPHTYILPDGAESSPTPRPKFPTTYVRVPTHIQKQTAHIPVSKQQEQPTKTVPSDSTPGVKKMITKPTVLISRAHAQPVRTPQPMLNKSSITISPTNNPRIVLSTPPRPPSSSSVSPTNKQKGTTPVVVPPTAPAPSAAPTGRPPPSPTIRRRIITTPCNAKCTENCPAKLKKLGLLRRNPGSVGTTTTIVRRRSLLTTAKTSSSASSSTPSIVRRIISPRPPQLGSTSKFLSSPHGNGTQPLTHTSGQPTLPGTTLISKHTVVASTSARPKPTAGTTSPRVTPRVAGAASSPLKSTVVTTSTAPVRIVRTVPVTKAGPLAAGVVRPCVTGTPSQSCHLTRPVSAPHLLPKPNYQAPRSSLPSTSKLTGLPPRPPSAPPSVPGKTTTTTTAGQNPMIVKSHGVVQSTQQHPNNSIIKQHVIPTTPTGQVPKSQTSAKILVAPSSTTGVTITPSRPLVSAPSRLKCTKACCTRRKVFRPPAAAVSIQPRRPIAPAPKPEPTLPAKQEPSLVVNAEKIVSRPSSSVIIKTNTQTLPGSSYAHSLAVSKDNATQTVTNTPTKTTCQQTSPKAVSTSMPLKTIVSHQQHVKPTSLIAVKSEPCLLQTVPSTARTTTSVDKLTTTTGPVKQESTILSDADSGTKPTLAKKVSEALSPSPSSSLPSTVHAATVQVTQSPFVHVSATHVPQPEQTASPILPHPRALSPAPMTLATPISTARSTPTPTPSMTPDPTPVHTPTPTTKVENKVSESDIPKVTPLPAAVIPADQNIHVAPKAVEETTTDTATTPAPVTIGEAVSTAVVQTTDAATTIPTTTNLKFTTETGTQVVAPTTLSSEPNAKFFEPNSFTTLVTGGSKSPSIRSREESAAVQAGIALGAPAITAPGGGEQKRESISLADATELEIQQVTKKNGERLQVTDASRDAIENGKNSSQLVLDNQHVTIWHKIEKRKIAGNAAPLRRNLERYLAEHPQFEVYVDQNPRSKTPRRKRGAVMNPETMEAGEHIVLWDTKNGRKLAGNAAPLVKNLHTYLAKKPHLEVYKGQDRVGYVPSSSQAAPQTPSTKREPFDAESSQADATSGSTSTPKLIKAELEVETNEPTKLEQKDFIILNGEGVQAERVDDQEAVEATTASTTSNDNQEKRANDDVSDSLLPDIGDLIDVEVNDTLATLQAPIETASAMMDSASLAPDGTPTLILDHENGSTGNEFPITLQVSDFDALPDLTFGMPCALPEVDPEKSGVESSSKKEGESFVDMMFSEVDDHSTTPSKE